MINLFKKEDVKPQNPPEQPVFIEGQAKEFRDPKTGEWISQKPFPESHRKKIMVAFGKNGVAINQSVQLARQYQAVIKAMAETDKQITDNEKEITDVLKEMRDVLKLDNRWGINPQLMVLEKRDAPDA